MHKNPVSFIGEADASFGALRPVEHLQQILVYRQASAHPERVIINGVSKNFDRRDGLKSDMLLEEQLKGFLEFVDQLKLVDQLN